MGTATLIADAQHTQRVCAFLSAFLIAWKETGKLTHLIHHQAAQGYPCLYGNLLAFSISQPPQKKDLQLIYFPCFSRDGDFL